MKLVGKRGEITINGDQCTAVVTNKMVEKNWGSVVNFPVEDLPTWIRRLRIESTEDGNVRFTNLWF